ncbi:carbohydrate esterase family 9 protein [Cercospora zeae-maydis SCOH1-5]|uniref:N-acetylglucosamine-6-phosphate deacetylase n=1 Tax=Cercospora zeae-maydis SCOH1-5 TaxID=717836 RepID=A0A6A6FNI0_9PEZI|nr:carbohydrate esterase family 9 protein [Cercospora zeae-maydis SCOH1-5]
MSQTTFINARLCRHGVLVANERLVVSSETGTILPNISYEEGDIIDLDEAIIAPGYIELQTNGVKGFHFTNFENETQYAEKLDQAARFLATTGVTGFYPTIPTVPIPHYHELLPNLKPRPVPNGATILGAHVEGPYLHPSKKGAHTASLFLPATNPPEEIYGTSYSSSQKIIKLLTLAPELPYSDSLIHTLTTQQNITVSLGHSSATYPQGLSALSAGATCLTHVLNAMTPLHHRDPVTLLYRSSPSKCILITDSIELLGLPDGTYPGNSQIDTLQTKVGSKVVKTGSDTLIGGCATLDLCVRNLMQWAGISVAEAVRCVTENVVGLMKDETRGKLEVGRRGDLVVLDDGGNVLQTWIGGRKVWEKQEDGTSED